MKGDVYWVRITSSPLRQTSVNLSDDAKAAALRRRELLEERRSLKLSVVAAEIIACYRR